MCTVYMHNLFVCLVYILNQIFAVKLVITIIINRAFIASVQGTCYQQLRASNVSQLVCHVVSYLSKENYYYYY